MAQPLTTMADASSSAVSSPLSPLSSLESNMFEHEHKLEQTRAKISSYIPAAPLDPTSIILEAFIRYLPTTGASNIADDILQTEDLNTLGRHLLNSVLVPMKANRPTPAITPSPRFGMEQDVEETLSEMETVSRDQRRIKKLCLERDNHRCLLTGVMDMAFYWGLPADERPNNTLAGAATEAAHIIPFSVANFNERDAQRFGIIWDALYRCFPRLRASLNFRSDINNLCNIMTLWSDAHTEFGKFNLALEETAPNTYTVVKYHVSPFVGQYLPTNVAFTAHANHPLPHPELLKIHASIAKILHMTGMAEVIEKVLREREGLRCLAADGSTNLELLLLVV